jgi:hypothetical protein
LAITYPQVGAIASILGALGAFLCIYSLPTITYLAQKKTEIDNPALMRALRINDFSMSPPKSRAKRESLYDAESLDKDIKGGDARKPQDFVMKDGSSDPPAILQGKSPNGNNEQQRHVKEAEGESKRKREFVFAVMAGIFIICYGFYVLYL